jgi:hypothetical protein
MYHRNTFSSQGASQHIWILIALMVINSFRGCFECARMIGATSYLHVMRYVQLAPWLEILIIVAKSKPVRLDCIHSQSSLIVPNGHLFSRTFSHPLLRLNYTPLSLGKTTGFTRQGQRKTKTCTLGRRTGPHYFRVCLFKLQVSPFQ